MYGNLLFNTYFQWITVFDETGNFIIYGALLGIKGKFSQGPMFQ
jgi:hypothetical protein